MPKQLTADQSFALDSLLLFATKSPDRIFTLSGFAGVGKTTVMTEYAKELLDRGVPVVLCAPTNKAVAVDKKIIDALSRRKNVVEYVLSGLPGAWEKVGVI